MSIRGDLTCIYTPRRKCITIFTGNIPASKGTVEPSISRIWILISRKTFFPQGDNKHFENGVPRISTGSELFAMFGDFDPLRIAVRRGRNKQIPSYCQRAYSLWQFRSRGPRMRFHIGPLATRMTFPVWWGVRGVSWKRHEYYRNTGRWMRYWRVWRKSDRAPYPCFFKFSVCRTPVSNCRNPCCTPSNGPGVA